MPTDANGNYALPGSYLAVAGQTIQPSQHNPPLEDIGAGLTARLMRNGSNAMTGPFKAADGTVGAPSITFGSATSSGIYKTTSGYAVTINGTKVAEFGAGGLLSGVQTVSINDQAVTYPKMVAPSAASRLLGSNANAALTITAAANNGSGLIRLTVASTATFSTGQKKIVAGVTGTTEANGRWTITVVNGTQIDLQGSAFTNAYVNGGTIGGGVDELLIGSGLQLIGDTLNAALNAVSVANYLSGLILSTAGSSATFGISAGAANDSGNVDLMVLAAAITKTTSAWAVGSGNGALDTGTIAINTWYHVHEIKRPDTGVVDVLVSLSATAPTLPANYTRSRRIGSMKTDGAAQWTKFTQVNDRFIWAAPVTDLNGVAAVASRTNVTLTVPTGIVVEALIRAAWNNGSGSYGIYTSLLENDQTPSAAACDIAVTTGLSGQGIGTAQVARLTNTSAQIGRRATSTAPTEYISTYGWNDFRGK